MCMPAGKVAVPVLVSVCFTVLQARC
jgi:hypothetical protein